jgi:HAD superfamily hydrolase (TIGR01509 family)
MALPNKVHAVLFDMDGLIVDSEVVFRDAMFAAAADGGFELPPAVFHRMIGTSWTLGEAILREHFGEAFDTNAFAEASSGKFYAQVAEAGLCLKAGVLELLDDLDRLALPRAVATSSSHEAVSRSLGPHGLPERFHAIVARGDYAQAKPHPDPFLTAAARLAVEPAHCLVLEDSHNGVRAAHAAGMMAVMVPDLLDPTEEMMSLCCHIAEDLHRVRDLLAAQAR